MDWSSRVRAASVALALGSNCVAPSARAQLSDPGAPRPPRMVADLRPTDPVSSNPANFAPFGDAALFTAGTTLTGTDLWLTDGTVAGTRVVKHTAAASITDLGTGKAIFWNVGLWVTDGTDAGTFSLGATPPSSGAHTDKFTVVAGKAYFDDWVTDGTPAGTFSLTPTASPAPTGGFLSYFGSTGPRAIIAARSSTSTFARDLYATDGTPGGTVSLGAFGTGAFPLGTAHSPSGTRFVFGVVDTGSGSTNAPPWSVWVTDGSLAGTYSLGVHFTEVLFGNTLEKIEGAAVGDDVYFKAFTADAWEIWKTNGTAAGTTMRLHAPALSSAPVIKDFVAVRGRVLFRADNALWTCDPIPGDSNRLLNSRPGPLASTGDAALFPISQPATGWEVWISDGTVAGTRLLGEAAPGAANGVNWSDIYPGVTITPRGGFFVGGGSPYNLFCANTGVPSGGLVQLTGASISGSSVANGYYIAAGVVPVRPSPASPWGLVFAGADGAGSELWTIDPGPGLATASATHRLLDLAPYSQGSSPQQMQRVGNKAMFFATPDASPPKLFVSDGTAGGTRAIAPAGLSWNCTSDSCGWPHSAHVAGGRYCTQGNTAATGMEMFSSDGTLAGTTLVADTLPGSGFGYADTPTDSGSLIYFRQLTSPQRLWRSDFTPAGTFPVTSQSGANAVPGIDAIGGVNGLAVFCQSGVPRLYRSAGVAGDATLLHSNLLVRVEQSGPTFYRAGNFLYFFATLASGSTTGYEVWATDGTPAGTQPLGDFNPGFADSTALINGAPGSPLWAFVEGAGGRAVFAILATGATPRSQLWTSDGTPAGTRQIFIPGLPSGAFGGVHALARFGTGIVFTAITSNSSRLFTADGTGTDAVQVPTAGLAAANDAPAEARARAYFPSFSGPWTTDGTAAGTHALAPLSGPAPTSVRSFVAVNSRVFFVGTTLLNGEELWVIDACPADLDNSGQPDIDDLFAYLNDWFAQGPAADFNASGSVEVQDIFDYLNAWFAGC